jgi:hypothetical protein
MCNFYVATLPVVWGLAPLASGEMAKNTVSVLFTFDRKRVFIYN